MKSRVINSSALISVLVAAASVSLASAGTRPRQCKVWADPPGNLTISQTQLTITEGTMMQLFLEIPVCDTNDSLLTFHTEDDRVAEVAEVVQLPPDDNPGRFCWTYRISIIGKRLGFTPIWFSLRLVNHTEEEFDSIVPELYEGEVAVTVLRPRRFIDMVYWGILRVAIILLNLAFGCALDLKVVKEILRRPVAPAIGFFCQFCIMPLLGLGVSKGMGMDNIFAFGLLTLSCSPGGGGSNVWSVLLKGDVNLSLTMTFFSLVCSLGLMPFWLFALSRFYIDPSQVQVPFKSILITLASFIFPCIIGLLLRRFNANLGSKIARLIKPFALIFIVFIIVFTPYVNLYIYTIIGQMPSIVAPAMMLPWCGFGLGYVIATLLGQPRYRAVTIAIETGIQNFSISLVLLQQSFPQPFGNLAAVMPLIVAHFTPLPLYISYLCLVIRNLCCGRYKKKLDAEGGLAGNREVKDEENETSHETVETSSPLVSGGGTTKSGEDKQDIARSLPEKQRLDIMILDAKETVL